MGDVKFTVEAVLDSKQAVRAFGQVEKAGSDTAKKVTSSFQGAGNPFNGLNQGLSQATVGFGNLGSAISRVALPLLGLTGAIAGVRAAFNSILDAERAALEINAFNAAAQNAGVNASRLLGELERANAGIADFGEITLTASQALNVLGEGANEYPQLLEVARRASIQFGGTVQENFEQLNQAILTGRTRALGPSIGLFVDATRAAEDYARSIGTSARLLTEQERAQATLNAVLRTAQTTYAGVDLANENLTVKVDRLRTTFTELGKDVGAALESLTGTNLRTFTDEITTLLNNLRGFIAPKSELDTVRDSIRETEKELQFVNSSVQRFGSFTSLFIGQNATEATQKLEERLKNLNTRFQELLQTQSQVERAPAAETGGGPQGLSDEQIALREQSERTLNERLAAIRAEARQAEIQAQLVQAGEDERIRLEIEAARIAHEQRLTQIQKENAELRFVDRKLLEEIELAERERFLAQTEKIIADSEQRRLAASQKNNQFVLQATQAVNQAIVSVLSSAAQQLGQALANGTGGFQSFANAALDIIGNLLINIGQSMLAAGLALLKLKFAIENPTNPVSAFIGGAALIALGSALKSLSQANGSGETPTPAPTPTFGGGVTDTGGFPVQAPREDDRQRQAEQSVQVVIQGDVIDSESSGIRIVELINQAFDKQGVTVRRGAIA